MSKSLRFLCYLIALGLLSGLVSWFVFGRLWLVPVKVAVKQHETVLPYLQEHQVRAYRSQSWCKNIAYKAGAFSESTHPSTCNLFDDEPQPLLDQARSDFQSLRRRLRGTGFRIAFINTYWVDNSLKSAEFDLNCWLCSHTRYVYEPNYVLPNDIADEMWFTPINQNWHRVNED
jgi:hypothetical protein